MASLEVKRTVFPARSAYLVRPFWYTSIIFLGPHPRSLGLHLCPRPAPFVVLAQLPPPLPRSSRLSSGDVVKPTTDIYQSDWRSFQVLGVSTVIRGGRPARGMTALAGLAETFAVVPLSDPI
ncbi:hypothetical protein DPMN_156338 [Dreissena polymorpha]|uniref:Uncharacterized protein n=1 Tax=Dreissena polymorpha TaxID=45954 RepID=A0A9D4FPN4_DREPO|nr:hypothetical protein DPMN_156338 [Dreissena polymorpha]